MTSKAGSAPGPQTPWCCSLSFLQKSFFCDFMFGSLTPSLLCPAHCIFSTFSHPNIPHIFAFGGWGNIKTELRWRWPHQPWSCQTTPKETAGTSSSKSLSSPSSSIQHPSQISGESIHHHQNCQPHLLINLDFRRLPRHLLFSAPIYDHRGLRTLSGRNAWT